MKNVLFLVKLLMLTLIIFVATGCFIEAGNRITDVKVH